MTTRLLSRSLLLLSALAFVAPARAGEPSALDASIRALSEGHWKDAADLAATVTPNDADYAKARYVLGEAQLVLGDAEAAEKAFQEVLATRPEAVPAAVGLARALVALGHADEALERLEKTLAAAPHDVDALRVRGEAYLAKGETKKALHALDLAAKADAKDVLVARALVEANLAADDPKEAERVAKKIAKARPKHPMGPFLLGLVLERRGKDDDAIEAYEKALALDDAFLDAHKNLAILCHTMSRTYQDVERVKKAMVHYARYFELGGHDPKLEETYRTTKAFLESQGLVK